MLTIENGFTPMLRLNGRSGKELNNDVGRLVMHTAVDFSLADAGMLGNSILDRIGAMRKADPIYRSAMNGGVWMITGHAEVTEAFAGKFPLSAARLPHMVVGSIPEAERMTKIPYLMTSTAHWLVNMDRPAAWRLRTLAQKAFSAPVAEAQRPLVRRSVAEAFDATHGQQSIEIVGEIGRRVTGETILRLLDLPHALLPRLHAWSVAANAALTTVGMPEDVLVAGEKTLLEMRALFLPRIAERRAKPTDDFISSLVTAQEGQDSLEEEEILGILYLALIAGHDTTTNSIALGTAALAGLPQVRQYMRARPDRIGDAVMEISRHIAMSTLQGRIAAEDFMWNGHAVRRGDVVLLVIAGANRDPAVFEHPERLDLDRPQGKNMTFGPGLHFCIGHFLAKMQLQEYFSALVERYDPELLDKQLAFGSALGFRGLDTLHMRLLPRGHRGPGSDTEFYAGTPA